jgi:multiple sugar transport system substrate-binding protein
MEEQLENQNKTETPNSSGPSDGGPPIVSPGGGGSKKMLWVVGGLVVVLVGAALAWFLMNGKNGDKSGDAANNGGKTKLVFMTHWLEKAQIEGIKDASGAVTSKGLQAYVDEYEKLNPDIDVELQQVHFNDYPSRLRVLADSGAAPDIYHIYAPWGAQYVRAGILAEPPASVKADVEASYISASGPTIEGKVWGYPTEINNYALLCNKDLMSQAGVAAAPKTWAELIDAVKKMTKRNAAGAITQYGIAFTKDAEWQVADPFLSLLFSNGGQYLTADLKKAAFNSDAGVQALEAMVQLFNDKSTDIEGQFFDFQDSKIGCVVAPPWTKGAFATSFGANFEAKVAVAPFPYMKKAGTLQYSWFTGVMKESKNQEAAWDFLAWLNTEAQSSGTTRMGDLLAGTIGAIPARKVDFEKHDDTLGDFFTSVYVGQMGDSTAEPNVLESDVIKEKLIAEIQAAWGGEKTAKEALDSAATEINKILELYY